MGIAFQSLKNEDAENIGYVIPTPVIMHFIQDYEKNGAYTGKIYCLEVYNVCIFQYLQLLHTRIIRCWKLESVKLLLSVFINDVLNFQDFQFLELSGRRWKILIYANQWA